MKLPDYIFYATISIMAAIVFLNSTIYTNYYSVVNVDEVVYQDTVSKWNANGTAGLQEAYAGAENKPVSFLAIQKVLGADPDKTRTLNLILVVLVTVLIYRITGRVEAMLYPIIPAFLNSWWLTAEIIEVLFVLLAINYKKYEGYYVGLAAVFRPYALLYSAVIRRRQVEYAAVVVGSFAAILQYYGFLWLYIVKLAGYGVTAIANNSYYDPIAIAFYFPMLILASQNKEMLKYGLIASVPLLFRQFGHYFIPSYSLFFLGYLCSKNTT